MLTIENLVKVFASARGAKEPVTAVNGINLHIERGEFFTLLGPSGCGKSTTLRCIAGLEQPTSGEITLADVTLYSSKKRVNRPAYKRGLGMVFQSYAIWPHMSVAGNVGFPLKVRPGRSMSRRHIAERVERALEAVHLDGLASRSATALSGGQQQRLALARALIMEPPLLLLDEPLSNLDATLRDEMRFELKRLQDELGITTLYVTHDQVEALAMSSRIAVMNSGNVEQVGTPDEIYSRPSTPFVAGFIGTSNMMDVEVVGSDAGLHVVDSSVLGRVRIAYDGALPTGRRGQLVVRPEDVRLRRWSVDEEGIRGEVRARSYVGDAIEYRIVVGSAELLVKSTPSVNLTSGDAVALLLDPSNLHIIIDEVKDNESSAHDPVEVTK